tara:strand:+ start:306 stop:503 length:198 start_codon:yes stop_codon:yes gene_type:complete
MSLKLLVNNKEIWDSFNKELDIRLKEIHIAMEQALNDVQLYRLQGQANSLRNLKGLRDKVNANNR